MVFIFGGAYAGKEMYAKREFPDKKIIRDIHLIIKSEMEKGKNALDAAERLVSQNTDAVFISNEIGCGIIPADKLEREWREAVGRVNCYLAAKAEKVIRVVCGIGVTIK